MTGAAGFIGANLVRRLIEQGLRVVAVVRPGSNLWRLDGLLGNMEIIAGELGTGDSGWLSRAMSGADYVFHLAARGVDPRDQDMLDLTQANLMGTMQVLREAQIAHVHRLVYCGSCFEYGQGHRIKENALLNPTSPYSVTKAAAWLYARMFSRNTGFPLVGLRPFQVYGPLESAERLIPYAIRCALENRELLLTEGGQARDFVFVGDVVAAFMKAAVQGEAPGATYNVCTGVAVSIRHIVETILRLTGSTAKPRWGAIPRKEGEILELSGNPEMAYQCLQWTPTTCLADGLEQTIEWVRAHDLSPLTNGPQCDRLRAFSAGPIEGRLASATWKAC